jgi:von Willebrand factor type A domain
MIKITRLNIILFAVLANVLHAAETVSTATTNDIRILIDVSGSMKKNDPENLRRPATNLLIDLLPKNSRAGIWLFAENTRELIPVDTVNDTWKKRARSQMQQIHSRGLFTDIEKALQTAIEDWNTPNAQQQRSLILLTDGVVDISKNKAENAGSNERIISLMIPEFQRQNIQVHTIALSNHADIALLKKLSIETNGWNETVYSAEQLQRTFLKMFNKVVPADTLPLKDNKFTIDSSIKEFSILIFNKPDAPYPQLILPNNSSISAAEKPENVSWRQEANYSLITVSKPAAGEWQIDAQMDPDNQVMIVTDLKFKLDALPNYLGEKEPIEISTYFIDQNTLITRKDFLDLLTITLQQTDALSRSSQWKMQPKQNKRGYFSFRLAETLSPGIHTLKMIADGKTFNREIVRTIEVIPSPVQVKTQLTETDSGRTIMFQLIPDPDIIDTPTMTAQAFISQAENEPTSDPIANNNNQWFFPLAAPPAGSRFIINFAVLANTVRGNPITPKIRPIIVDDDFLANLAAVEPKSLPLKPNGKTMDVPPAQQDIPADEPAAAPNWIMTGAITIAINLFLLSSGYYLYRRHKTITAEKQAQLLEKLL